MTKKQALNFTITTYWWNHGQKKKDFSGTYKEWFDKTNITFYTYKHNIIFNGDYGSLTIRLLMPKTDLIFAFNMVIRTCLTYLGDKALLIDGFNRKYKINWR